MKKTKPPVKLEKGFRAMSRAKMLEICRKGGRTISKNRAHMSEIGRVGGSANGLRMRKEKRAMRRAMHGSAMI